LTRAENAGADRISAAYLRGVLLFSRKQYREALNILVALTGEEQKAPYLILFIADIYQYHTGETAKAIPYLRQFLEMRYDPEIKNRLNELLENQEQRERNG
jgi:lipopolysaccharide biosynthesis regulator YciM